MLYINYILTSILLGASSIFYSAPSQNNLSSVIESPVIVESEVPFFSQFNDISSPEWKKIGCGITSLGMIIEYYNHDNISIDRLLTEGISSGAYLNGAGWIHQGLINLANEYGLEGKTVSFSSDSNDVAFSKFKNILKDGPVIVSVHYTFDPKNPIPHLVVINKVEGDRVYYNDPAETSGGKSISIEQFLSSWKKRLIVIRPNIY